MSTETLEGVMRSDTSLSLNNDEKLQKQPLIYVNEVFSASQTAGFTGQLILSILERYRLPHLGNGFRPLGVASIFLAQIERFIANGEPICMVLPAFPFKSANKETKVLGPLPDKGEETALLHLDGMCKAIGDVYEFGARLLIVSDGLVYNDILGISDQEVWRYGQALRQMAKNCKHLQFARLRDLISDGLSDEPWSEEAYIEQAAQVRCQISRQYLPQGFDASETIAREPDVNYTYCGYAKYLRTELAISLKEKSMSSKHTRRYCKDIAKSMIVRGKAFAEAIACVFPHHLRLSIHPSTDTKKLSIALIPQKGSCQMTPWHSALVRATDGSITMAHAQSVSRVTHELIYENGRPSYFRERMDASGQPVNDAEVELL